MSTYEANTNIGLEVSKEIFLQSISRMCSVVIHITRL